VVQPIPTLSDYTNVTSEAIHTLQQKGYQVWFSEAAKLYYAERGGWDFAADSATALLGVVAIYEHQAPKEYKEYWWRSADAQAGLSFDQLPRAPSRPYRSLTSKK